MPPDIALDMTRHFGALELATFNRNARPAPFLRTLGLVGSALHNRAVYAFFNVFVIVGALACGFFGGDHTNVIFWYFSASTELDRSAVIAVVLCVARIGIVLIISLPLLHSLRIVTDCMHSVEHVQSLEKEHSRKRLKRETSHQKSADGGRNTWEEEGDSLRESSYTLSEEQRRRSVSPTPPVPPPPTPAGAKATASGFKRQGTVHAAPTPSRSSKKLRRSSTKVISDANAAAENFKKKLWRHFWAHSIDASSDTHLLQYCLVATVVLMLGTLAGCGYIGISYYQAAEAVVDENRRIAYRGVSGFVYFGFIPFFCAPLFCLWFASLGLGAAVCKSELRRTTAVVMVSSPIDQEWDVQVVREIKDVCWSALRPLNTGWSQALTMQILAAVALAILTAMWGYLQVVDDGGRLQEKGTVLILVSFAASTLGVVLALLPAFVNARCAKLLSALNDKRLETLTGSARVPADAPEERYLMEPSVPTKILEQTKMLEHWNAHKVCLLVGALRDDTKFGMRLGGAKITPGNLRKVVAFIVFVYGLFAQLETGTAAPDSGSGIP